VNMRSRNNVTVTGREDGPSVLLAHGFGCDQNLWRLIVPDLAARYRVVLFDHTGAGRSDLSAWTPERYGSLDGYADDVLAICRELDLRDVVLVGHSVSAMIAVLAANREPDRFAKLVLLTPSPCYVDDGDYRGGFSAGEIDELLETMDGNYLGWSQHIAPVIMGAPQQPGLGAELAASFCRADPLIARHFARTTFLSDNRDDLQRVSTPALVVQCRDDVIAPVEVGRYVHDHVAGSEFALLDATGHCPNLSAPRQLVEAMDRYLGA
jgi:sigma-B regulation protein RsbQ